MPDFDYDLFTIGAGSGGVRASRVAAAYGASSGEPRSGSGEAIGSRKPSRAVRGRRRLQRSGKTGDGGNRARMVVGRRLATIEPGQAERLPARVPAKREREAGKKRSRGNRIGTAGPKGRRCQSGAFLGKCRARNLRMVFSVTPKYLASFGVVKPRVCSSSTLSR